MATNLTRGNTVLYVGQGLLDYKYESVLHMGQGLLD